MPLAGHDHVIVPIEPDFRRASGFMSCECGNGREPGTLCFLAAKPATHSPDLDRDRMIGQIEELCDVVLHLSWMLGG